jgi:hypothetical protein
MEKRITMEETQTPIVIIDGVQYDISDATPETAALINDLSTIQMELNRLKTSYDIASIARQTILGEVSKKIASGDSGLVALEAQSETEEAAQ